MQNSRRLNAQGYMLIENKDKDTTDTAIHMRWGATHAHLKCLGCVNFPFQGPRPALHRLRLDSGILPRRFHSLKSRQVSNSLPLQFVRAKILTSAALRLPSTESGVPVRPAGVPRCAGVGPSLVTSE